MARGTLAACHGQQESGRPMPTDGGPYFIELGDVWFDAGPGKADGGHRSARAGVRHVCGATMGLLAVAYDADDSLLHKHGSAGPVSKWAEEARARFLAGTATAGPDAAAMLGAMAAAITVVSFPVTPETVELLNGVIACSGLVATLQDRLAAIGGSYPDHPAFSFPACGGGS